MTDEELKGLALQSLNMAKVEAERGKFIFLLATYFSGEGLRRMTLIEEMLHHKLGKNWLNDADKKRGAFDFISYAIQSAPEVVGPPDAMAVVTAGNMFIMSKLGQTALTRAELIKLMHSGHDAHHRAVSQGFMELRDVLFSVVQTEEKAVQAIQTIADYGRVFVGAPEMMVMGQEEFDGNLKLYHRHPGPLGRSGERRRRSN